MRGRRELLAIACVASLVSGACAWDPTRPFDREAPQVRNAIAMLDAGDASAATAVLGDYLSAGACEDGKIGTPPLLKKRANGAYDLGLSLFGIGEAFGRRFGEEEADAPKSGGAAHANDEAHGQRSSQIECALRVVRAIADGNDIGVVSPGEAIELRSRARYLEGNLLFLGARYDEAVSAYDESLRLSPGMPDAGDPIARDAAWNRAIALRRIDDKKDAGDGGQDSGDSGGGGPSDGAADATSGKDGGKDGGDGKKPDKGDSGADGGSKPDDAGRDSGKSPGSDDDGGPPPPSKATQDERMLDQLENAPTWQQETAKKAAQKRHGHSMQDK